MLYIRKVRVASPGTMNQHITAVGYSGGTSGPLTEISRETAVSLIGGGHTFRSHNDRTLAEADVKVATSSSGTKYIRTESDGRESNNLLELPRY